MVLLQPPSDHAMISHCDTPPCACLFVPKLTRVIAPLRDIEPFRTKFREINNSALEEVHKFFNVTKCELCCEDMSLQLEQRFIDDICSAYSVEAASFDVENVGERLAMLGAHFEELASGFCKWHNAYTHGREMISGCLHRLLDDGTEEKELKECCESSMMYVARSPYVAIFQNGVDHRSELQGTRGRYLDVISEMQKEFKDILKSCVRYRNPYPTPDYTNISAACQDFAISDLRVCLSKVRDMKMSFREVVVHFDALKHWKYLFEIL